MNLKKICGLLLTFFALMTLPVAAAAQTSDSGKPSVMAGLHLDSALTWLRSGANRQGTTLAQLLFRSNTAPGFVPKLAPNHSLINSLISDDGSNVYIGGMHIDSSGNITFAPNQSFPQNGNTAGYVDLNSNQSVNGVKTFLQPITGNLNGTANNALALADLAASAYQQRVSGACPPEGAISAINADGSVACLQPAANKTVSGSLPQTSPPNSFTGAKPETTGIAATLGSDNLPVFSFFDSPSGPLNVIHCNDIPCSSMVIHTLDSALATASYSGTSSGQNTAITIGKDGLPLIAYMSVYQSMSNPGALRVAHCNDVVCSASTVTTLDSFFNQLVGRSVSITIGVDGLGIISYFDQTNHLKTAHCADPACNSADVLNQLDTAYVAYGSASYYYFPFGTSIISGGGQYPWIAYYASSGGPGALRLVRCGDVYCHTSNVYAVTVSTSIGGLSSQPHNPSLAVGIDGNPAIAFSNGGLAFASCATPSCGSFVVNTVDNLTTQSGGYIVLQIGNDGMPFIAQNPAGNSNFVLSHCLTTSCSSAVNINVGPQIVTDFSFVIGSDGNPFFPLFGKPVVSTSNYLSFFAFHCSNPTCASPIRR